MTEADAKEEATRAAAGRGFTEHLADKLGASARASAVFGDAVDRDGMTIIPVARAKWGLGGQSASRDGEEGGGGGGGVSVSPIGFIELHGEEARFRRFSNRAPIAAAVVASGLLAVIGFRLIGLIGKRRQSSAKQAGVKWLVLKPAAMMLKRRAKT